MRPISELLFGEDGFEKLERNILMRVTFHVEIDECTELSCAAQNRTQLRREMRNCIGRVGRIHLRVERGNFNRNVYNREKLRIFPERIRPALRFAGETLQ